MAAQKLNDSTGPDKVRKHHFNCEIYTACMYLQIKTTSSGIYKGLKCSSMFVCVCVTFLVSQMNLL